MRLKCGIRRYHWIVICFTYGILCWTSPAQNVHDIRTLFADLSQPSTTDHAARHILQAARKDPEVRRYVVERLPGMIDKTETDKVWLNAVRLAGHLKASETVPSLQRAFSRGQLGRPAGTTLGAEMQLDDDVVAKALSEIGDPSLPSVKDFLTSDDRTVRRRAVLILMSMNSPAARKALEDRLSRETDPRIRDLIEDNLRSKSP
jgi:HEAT repeat protein